MFGSTLATDTNNLGVPTQDDASTVLIRGGEVLRTDHLSPMVKKSSNDKRYGVTVNYNSDTQNFTFASGSTGELIEANGALGVTSQQKASAISWAVLIIYR